MFTSLVVAANNKIRQRMVALCAVVTELTHEAHASNIVNLARQRGSPIRY